MADPAVGALMLIISVMTSATPANDLDDTHVMTTAYPTMQACKSALSASSLSDAELQVEREHAIRVLRACVRPGDEFWYTWSDGHIVSDDPSMTVESGSYRKR